MTETLAELTVADLLLALIPLPLLAGALTGLASSLSMVMALGAGSVPASGLVGYALFCTGVER